MKNKIIMLFVIFIFTLGTITYANGLFKDVKSDAWYYNAVERVVSYGIMQGYNGEFRPSDSVTRAELATVVSNLIYQQEEMMKQNNATDEQVINVVAKSTSAVVRIETETGRATGFIVKHDGTKNQIVTNHHVIEGDNNIKVILSNGKEYVGEVVRTDEYNDLAIISIDEEDKLNHLELSTDPKDLRIGSDILIIANPLGLNHTVTRGVISHNDRDGLIQTDAGINAGSSGSPIININSGKVVSITVSKVMKTGVDNLGFGIKADRVESLLNGEIRIQ